MGWLLAFLGGLVGAAFGGSPAGAAGALLGAAGAAVHRGRKGGPESAGEGFPVTDLLLAAAAAALAFLAGTAVAEGSAAWGEFPRGMIFGTVQALVATGDRRGWVRAAAGGFAAGWWASHGRVPFWVPFGGAVAGFALAGFLLLASLFAWGYLTRRRAGS